MSAARSIAYYERGDHDQRSAFEREMDRQSAIIDANFARFRELLARPVAYSPEWWADFEREQAAAYLAQRQGDLRTAQGQAQ